MAEMSNETLKAIQRANRMRSRFALKIREFLMDEFCMNEHDAQAVLDAAWKSVQAEFKEVKSCSK